MHEQIISAIAVTRPRSASMSRLLYGVKIWIHLRYKKKL